MNRKVIKARDVMREKHIEMDGLATVREALNAMKTDHSEVVIVKKRDEHDAFGIVLISDIAKKVLAKDRAPERVNLYEIMSKPLIPLDPEMNVRHCARLYESFGLSNAPVVENGQVIGIVSYSELVFRGLCELID
jgi:predicted transcriptional regulator